LKKKREEKKERQLINRHRRGDGNQGNRGTRVVGLIDVAGVYPNHRRRALVIAGAL
jgi:hypothetical protein